MSTITIHAHGRAVVIDRPGACSVAAMERLRPFYVWLHTDGPYAGPFKRSQRRRMAAEDVARWSVETARPIGQVELAHLIGCCNEVAGAALRQAAAELQRKSATSATGTANNGSSHR